MFRSLYLNLLLSLLFSFSISSNAADPKLALQALESTEKLLKENTKGGAGLAAQTLLDFIAEAKQKQIQNLPATVGYFSPDAFGAEFGSTSSDWRINGPIKKTPNSMSLTYKKVDNGNYFFIIHVILPNEINSSGYIGKEVKASLMVFPKKGTASLSFGTGLKLAKSRNDTWGEGIQLSTEFKLNEPSPKKWEEVKFTPEGTSVHSEIDENTIFADSFSCPQLLAGVKLLK